MSSNRKWLIIAGLLSVVMLSTGCEKPKPYPPDMSHCGQKGQPLCVIDSNSVPPILIDSQLPAPPVTAKPGSEVTTGPDTIVVTPDSGDVVVVNPPNPPTPVPPDTTPHFNEPAGFVAKYPEFQGTELPPQNSCRTPNQYGMCAWAGQVKALSLRTESGVSFMRTLYPGRNSPQRDSVWGPDGGGGAPSRWMQAHALPRGMGQLYIRVKFRVSKNWSQWGTKPPYTERLGFNVGTKFFFPRSYGLVGPGTAITAKENDYVGLLNASDYAADSIAGVWREPGAKVVEGFSFRYSIQQPAPNASSNYNGLTFPPGKTCNSTKGCQSGFLVPGTTCTRGEWCTLEVLLKHGVPGDSGTFKVWVNGVKHRDGKFATPRTAADAAATPLTKVMWDYVWVDMTFGGGTNIPWDDQWVDIARFYESVAP